MLRRKEMKIFTKHVTIFLLAIATALSLCLAIVCMSPGKVFATDLSGNLATKADFWVKSGNQVSVTDEGIKFDLDSFGGLNMISTAEKIDANATITLKYKTTGELARFFIQFKDTAESVPTNLGFADTGSGNRMVIRMRRVAGYYSNYTIGSTVGGTDSVIFDNNETGNLNSTLDGNEHTLIIKTEDVDNGIKVTVKFDSYDCKINEKVIERTELKGAQYLSFGVVDANPTTFTMTSVEIKVQEPPAEKDFIGNVALKENQWVAKGTDVTFTDEGIKWNLNGSSGLNMVSTAFKFNANSTVALRFRATGDLARFFIQFKDTKDSVPESLDYTGNKVMIQMRRSAAAVPNFFIQQCGNIGGPNYGGEGQLFMTNAGDLKNPMFDGNEHSLVIITQDVDNGIKLSVYMDVMNNIISEKVVESAGLKGDQYLSFGVVDANPSTFTMTSVEINESTERNFEGDLSGNLATKADMWMANNGKISFGNEGITIASETASSTNASVVLKQKVAANAIMRIKFKASEGLDNFIVQFKDPRSVMPHGAGYGYEGSQLRLSVDLRGSNLPLPTKNVILFNNATPDSDNPTWGTDTWFCTGDGSASNQYFDNEEHEMVIATRDSKTGVQVFVRVDGEKLYQGTVKKKALFGEQYIAIGCKSLKQNTNVTITSVEIDQPVTGDEVSVMGASLRIVDGEFTGFRFNLAFDKKTLDCLIADGAGVNITSVTVGAVIAPKWMVTKGTALEIGATDVLNIENDKELFEKDGKYLLNAVITNIGSVTENVNRYKMEFMARAYVKVTYKNGDIEIYYGEAITRSIAGVAADALEAQGDVLEADVKSVLEGIVNACNA